MIDCDTQYYILSLYFVHEKFNYQIGRGLKYHYDRTPDYSNSKKDKD